jgi:hypothetical protein
MSGAKYRWLVELARQHSAGGLGDPSVSALRARWGLGTHQARIVGALASGRDNVLTTDEHRASWVDGLGGDADDDAGPDEPGLYVSPAPESETWQEILARRVAMQERDIERAASKHTRTVVLPDALPFGVLLMGDAHLDDDYCDIALAFRHAEMVRDVDGLYGLTVGDWSNNWVGRLERKHGDQRTRKDEANALVLGYLQTMRASLVGAVAGNHDLWNEGMAILRAALGDSIPMAADELIVSLTAKGCDPFVIHARHNFKGHSQYDPAFGAKKAALMNRVGSDLYVDGHKHTHSSGQSVTGAGQCFAYVKLGAYKIVDEYATAIDCSTGMRGDEACLVIVRPGLPRNHPGRTRFEWDVPAGVEYLSWLRSGRGDRAG